MDKRDIISATQHGRDVCNHQAIELLRVCNLFVASTRRARHEGCPDTAFPSLPFVRDEVDSPEFCLIAGDLEVAERSIRETINALTALLAAIHPASMAAQLLCEGPGKEA